MRCWLEIAAVVSFLAVGAPGPWSSRSFASPAPSASKSTGAQRCVAVARAGRKPSAPPTGAQQQRTDTELMFDAVNKWRGESPSSAKIERISAEARADARAEAKRQKALLSVAPIWKDPFAEDPDRPIPVRMNMSKQKELVVARRELARARADAASAQADAAKARADAAKANANAARTEAMAALAQAVAAKHEAVAARNACGAEPERHGSAARAAASAASAASSQSASESQEGFDSFSPPKRSRVNRTPRRAVASNASFKRSTRGSGGAAPADAATPAEEKVAPAPPPVETPPPPTPPVAFANSGSGIIVVPITR
jgi:trimeric autotransporter adhesin